MNAAHLYQEAVHRLHAQITTGRLSAQGVAAARRLIARYEYLIDTICLGTRYESVAP
jgi:hypothetical protein